MSKMSTVSMKTLNGLSGSKKAQGLSLNTIIIAIIVLIVLVVIVIIFTGYFGSIFTPSVKSCTAQGGECAEQCGFGQLGNEIVGGECTTPEGGTPLRCCSKIPLEQFTPTQTIASCGTQGGSCSRSIDDKNDKDCTDPTGCAKKPDGTFPAGCDGTCTKVPVPCATGTTQLSAPGCENNGLCCKK